MNTQFTIKNFRAFNSNGENFTIAPLTLLTGCNSAGKSSMVKALLLLNNFFNQMKKDIKLTSDCYPAKYKLGITDYCYRLGDFASVLNREANNNQITFSYTIKPQMAIEPFCVEYSFESNKNDTLNDGWLSNVSIKNKYGELLYKIEVKDSQLLVTHCDLSLLKTSFAQFSLFSLKRDLTEQIEVYHQIPEVTSYTLDDIKKFKKIIEHISPHTKDIDTQNILDFNEFYLNTERNKQSDIFTKLSDYNKVDDFLDTNIIYYLPILKILTGITKNDVRSVLYQHPSNFWNEDLAAIVSDFENSTHSTFNDYVRHFEDSKGLHIIGWGLFDNMIDQGLKKLIKSSLSVRTYHPLDNIEYEYAPTVNLLAKRDEQIKSSFDYSEDEKKKKIEEKKEERRKNITFEFLIQTLWDASLCIDNSFKDLYRSKYEEMDLNGSIHPTFKVFAKYTASLLQDLLIPTPIFDQLYYISSSRVDVQRLYNINSHNDSFGQTLSDYFIAKRNCKDKNIAGKFLKKWIKRFDIANSITIKNVGSGLGIAIYLHSTPTDKKGHLLADDGYGITQLVSILLKIETNILTSTKTYHVPYKRKLYRKYDDEVKQHLTPSTIAIEEPEIHLHPRYQSLLAEMFVDAYKNYNIRFIIETHSEYLIRKIQTLIAKQCITQDDVAIHYIAKDKYQTVKQIAIKEDGRLANAFGSGFFDEADNLAMDLLTFKVSK